MSNESVSCKVANWPFFVFDYLTFRKLELYMNPRLANSTFGIRCFLTAHIARKGVWWPPVRRFRPEYSTKTVVGRGKNYHQIISSSMLHIFSKIGSCDLDIPYIYLHQSHVGMNFRIYRRFFLARSFKVCICPSNQCIFGYAPHFANGE